MFSRFQPQIHFPDKATESQRDELIVQDHTVREWQAGIQTQAAWLHSSQPFSLHCLTMAIIIVWGLHPSESPAEAEATGTFLDEEPLRLMEVVEEAEAGPQVPGKGTRLGRWATVEPATNSH